MPECQFHSDLFLSNINALFFSPSKAAVSERQMGAFSGSNFAWPLMRVVGVRGGGGFSAGM